MKKTFLGILICLCLSTSVFGLDKFINSYQCEFLDIYNFIDHKYQDNLKNKSFIEYRAGLIWDKFSLNISTDIQFVLMQVSFGYNLINTENVVWSIGPALNCIWFVPYNFGLSTDFDYLIPINDKINIDLGIGVAGYYNIPYEAGKDEKHLYSYISVYYKPRIGISTKINK